MSNFWESDDLDTSHTTTGGFWTNREDQNNELIGDNSDLATNNIEPDIDDLLEEPPSNNNTGQEQSDVSSEVSQEVKKRKLQSADVETVVVKKKRGFHYVDDTIPWRYRQHPCPSKLCSRDRGHPGNCVVDLRYKLDVDLTGKQVYNYIHKQKQAHASNMEIFWTSAEKKLDKYQEQVSSLISPLDGVYTKRQLGQLVISNTTQLRGNINKLKAELSELEVRLDDLDYAVGEEIDKLGDKVTAFKVLFDLETSKIKARYEDVTKDAEKKVQEKVKEYENFMMRASRSLVCPFWVLKSRQEVPTTKQMLFGKKFSRKRQYRREKTKDVLEFIHGTIDGACYGARLFLKCYATDQFWEEMLLEHKGGRFIKKHLEKLNTSHMTSEETMRKAIAQIYVGHMSRRKYMFMTRINDSYYDPDSCKWLRRKAQINGIDIQLAKSIPYKRVESFIKQLDIGPVTQIPNHMGVTRTLTSLAISIVELNIKVAHLHDKLVWFNNRPYHFVMQFSDDGAPETKELTMSIGTLTCWNLGQKVRSRELQYFLHGLSVPEKAAVMSDLWTSHTNEMATMEGCMYTICGKRCSFSFEPSADMSWQSWAANEMGQSSLYFSPYANVSLNNKATVNGTIGDGDHYMWRPWLMDERLNNVKKIEEFEREQPHDQDDELTSLKRRDFLRKNKMRQLGMPRIGKFVNQLRPEPLHTEINAWQYLLNLVYREAQRRHMINKILAVIAAPPNKPKCKKTDPVERLDESHTGTIDGQRNKDMEELFWDTETSKHVNEDQVHDDIMCGAGIPALAKQIVEAANTDNRRLRFRLIGPQAVALARNWHKICRALKLPNENGRDKYLRLALYKMGLCLREAASLFQQTQCDDVTIVRVKTLLQIYFNLHVLFFGPQCVSVTTWTLGYALPYHMKKLYGTYKVGYGITSMQSREAENAGIKLDLGRTNRSRSTSGDDGKWWQVCRWNYVRTFYLPEHEPIPSNYKPQSDSRRPDFKLLNVCKECGEKVELNETCQECDGEEMNMITESTITGELLPQLAQILNKYDNNWDKTDVITEETTSSNSNWDLYDIDDELVIGDCGPPLVIGDNVPPLDNSDLPWL